MLQSTFLRFYNVKKTFKMFFEEMTTDGQSDWLNGNQEKGKGGEVDKKWYNSLRRYDMGEISQRQEDLEGSWGGLYIQHWIDTA